MATKSNLAEQFSRKYDVKWQTVYNGASRMSHVTAPTVTKSEFYFGLDVPEGRRLVVFDRTLKATEGVYRVDVVVPSDGFSGGTPTTKSRLNAPGLTTVQSILYADVTPSGSITVADEDFIDTGTGVGASHAGGAPAVEEVMVMIRGKSCLRVTSENGGAAYRLGIRLVVWEEDDV